MSTSAASSSSSAPSPAQLTLFARSALAHLRLWPALRLAFQNAEISSGPTTQSVQLFASEIVETFLAAKSSGPVEEDVEDLLLQIMDEEFDTIVDDESAQGIARGLLTTWRNLADPSAEESIRLLEEQADRVGRTKVQVQQREEIEEASDEDEDGEEEEEADVMDVDEAPKLVEKPQKEREEAVVDEEGFTLVQKKGRR